jgi:hypothetical protein
MSGLNHSIDKHQLIHHFNIQDASHMLLQSAYDDPYSQLKAAYTNPLSVTSEEEESCGGKGPKVGIQKMSSST